MRLLPRHYLLLAAVIALAAFNFYRIQHKRNAAMPVIVRGTSPIWTIYDVAAKLRDSGDDDFQPALQQLAKALDDADDAPITPEMSAADLTNMRACQTWLLFYRQEVLHPSNRDGWKAQTLTHVQSCAANHTDIDNKAPIR